MSDPRYAKLARLLVGHSTRLGAGDTVLIEATHIPHQMLCALSDAAIEAGALPVIDIKDTRVNRKLMKSGDLEQVTTRMKLLGELELSRMKRMTAYIGLRGAHNITEMSDVPPDRMSAFEEHWLKPVHLEQRVKHTRWCVLRWPTPSMAQQAGMSSEAFEDFYFDVCLADYAAMDREVQPLKRLMERTDRVRITGTETDLRFSIRNIGVVPCAGTHNIPDGECFTAPVRDSVEGSIAFNAGTIYRGTPFDNIRLEFHEGRVARYSSSNDEALRAILEGDEGARYLGEFALAFNPFISRPMRDILFDEKIRGSLHLALGQAYEETDNGNRSSVHWDLVLLQESGGEVHFDDVLIRKNGRFVPEELQGLNPEALAGGKVPAVR
ncbi:MAG: aminopeptidase [Armatimonadetes bacterium]|nr:aminopeptidase [Armatimonadota bacterium]